MPKRASALQKTSKIMRRRVAACRQISLVVEECAIALQKTSKIMRRRVAACRQISPVVEEWRVSVAYWRLSTVHYN